MLFIGCSDLVTDESDIEFSLNSRLNTDLNGYHHMSVIRNNIQTLHRLSGTITENGVGVENIRFEWESSHFWVLDDTLGYIVTQNFNEHGYYVSIDTSYMIGFNDMTVQTINCCSYSNSKGEVNTMLGVVQQMIGDTLTVQVRFNIYDEIQTQFFKIVLD